MLDDKTAITFDHDVFGTVTLRPNVVEVRSAKSDTLKRIVRYFAGEGDGRKSSPMVRVNREVFDAILSSPIVVGDQAAYGTHKMSWEEGDRGKAPSGQYRDRIVGLSVIVPHDDENVRITLEAIRDYHAPSGRLKDDYLISVEGTIVVESESGPGRQAAPTKTLADIGGLFG